MSSKKIKYYVLNIKLQSHKSGDQRLKSYENLIKKISNKKFTRINKNDAITMYPSHEREVKGIKYYYGTLGKGISFFDLNEVSVISNDNISKEPVDRDKIYKPVFGDYLYIPSIHRFALRQAPNSISLQEFEKFLVEHLPQGLEKDEKIEILHEKEDSIIDEIFKARAVYKLSYEISYTNNDGLSSQGELFDNILKENHVGKVNVTAESDHSDEGMKIENVDFLGGGIEVARKNGTIKSATILPLNSAKSKIISNKEKPSILETEPISEDADSNRSWFKHFLKQYKPQINI